MWIEPICDPNCNVTVNVFDLTFDQLLKINEFRLIRQSVETVHYEDMEEKIKRESR